VLAAIGRSSTGSENIDRADAAHHRASATTTQRLQSAISPFCLSLNLKEESRNASRTRVAFR